MKIAGYSAVYISSPMILKQTDTRECLSELQVHTGESACRVTFLQFMLLVDNHSLLFSMLTVDVIFHFIVHLTLYGPCVCMLEKKMRMRGGYFVSPNCAEFLFIDWFEKDRLLLLLLLLLHMSLSLIPAHSTVPVITERWVIMRSVTAVVSSFPAQLPRITPAIGDSGSRP